MIASGRKSSFRSADPAPDQAVHDYLVSAATRAPEEILADLAVDPAGLSRAEAATRREIYGDNRLAPDARTGALRAFAVHLFTPLNGLMALLAGASFALGDRRAALVISAIVLLSVLLAFAQERRSRRAAMRLRAMVRVHVSVARPEAGDADDGFVDVAIEDLVPGDIIRLAAGDMIPADVRVIDARDLFVNQSTLTGESLPVEKFAHAVLAPATLLDAENLAFMGTNVVSGYGHAVVLMTGVQTCFGDIAAQLVDQDEPSGFDESVGRFSWLMIRFMIVMGPLVFLINGYVRGDWYGAFLFAISVVVGLTPEMLPMIVTVNLARGALAISREKVIVKRLASIQDFGAMDVLCTDKTGTLTQDRIILKHHLDIYGAESAQVLEFAYLNSHFQSGLRNLLDIAVLEHADLAARLRPDHSFRKIDEIPFDFERRRLSVVVERDDGARFLICKGAVEEVLAVSTRFRSVAAEGLLDPAHLDAAMRETAALNADGFRVVAVAYRDASPGQATFSRDDESELTLLGYIAFLDPPRDSAARAIAGLAAAGVGVKILTGDNDLVTRKVCRDVGLPIGDVLLGAEIDGLDDAALAACATTTTIFARLTPSQKARIIFALRGEGHVVGFLGDGINDSLALKAADVGISVDTAADIARESADIILLEKSLLALNDAVIEGRKVFANILKYVRMGASSNFGNMFSVLGASAMLPFLPMTPVQILTNSLLYDFSQTAIPTDNVDPEWLAKPRKWDIDGIARFMLYVGPISSIFDYATFILMLVVFDAWDKPDLFQTGWFVESLLTQTLIVHIIRTNRIPFFESHASGALIGMTFVVCLAGAALPFSSLAPTLGLVPLPPAYWPALGVFLLLYAMLAHLAKILYVARWETEPLEDD